MSTRYITQQVPGLDVWFVWDTKDGVQVGPMRRDEIVADAEAGDLNFVLQHTALAAALRTAIGTSGMVIVDGLRITTYSNNVVNIERHDRQLTRTDVDAVRAAFTVLGLTEVSSWVPRQGVSWLSNGVNAGVSFKVTR